MTVLHSYEIQKKPLNYILDLVHVLGSELAERASIYFN